MYQEHLPNGPDKPERREFFGAIRDGISNLRDRAKDVGGFLLNKSVVPSTIEEIIDSRRLQTMAAHYRQTFGRPGVQDLNFEDFIRGHYPDVAKKLTDSQMTSLKFYFLQDGVVAHAESEQNQPQESTTRTITRVVKTGLVRLKEILGGPVISDALYLAICSDWQDILRQRKRKYPNEIRDGDEWKDMQYYLFYKMLTKEHSHLTDAERRYLADSIILGGHKSG